MKKNIINALVIFFLAFAVMLALTEMSGKVSQENQVTQSYLEE